MVHNYSLISVMSVGDTVGVVQFRSNVIRVSLAVFSIFIECFIYNNNISQFQHKQSQFFDHISQTLKNAFSSKKLLICVTSATMNVLSHPDLVVPLVSSLSLLLTLN